MKQKGFTLLEIIAVLVIIGILTAVAVSRSVNFDAEVHTGADILRSHLRYAQTTTMNSNPVAGKATIWGISGTGSNYWLFQGTDPNANIFRLPEDDAFIDANKKINLTAKKIKLTPDSFTIYFDDRGVPYTVYTSETVNTPLAEAMTINVKPLNAATPSIAVTITPFTGYVP